MTIISTPLSKKTTRLLLLGAGELGKEVAIEAQRFGIEVIALDRYENAPAMQVAHRAHVVNMMDGAALKNIIVNERPDFIVPEIEAIATDTLLELEKQGFNVIPSAKATWLTMNRKRIRQLASETLGLPTSEYRFAETIEEYDQAVKGIGLPCVVKPIMSSSGKGQSIVRSQSQVAAAWQYAQEGARGGGGEVIVERFIAFDSEITLLTVCHKGGTIFCEPIGHKQVDGDYRTSWQPHTMSERAKQQAQAIANKVTHALEGFGVFGVEFFIKGDEVYFNEVSPRPHDTGMVTMISQDLSEFALHVRAIVGLPIPNIRFLGPSASCAIVSTGHSNTISYHGFDEVLSKSDTTLRLFGKPEIDGYRRLGVALARSSSIAQARSNAEEMVEQITVVLA